MRRIKGIWPPSKPIRIELPERAVWPLPPRPLVLPWPLDSPWPRRLRRCLAPGRGLRSCNRMGRLNKLNELNKQRQLSRSWNRASLNSSRRLGGVHFSDFHSSSAINIFAEPEALQSLQGGFYHIGSVVRTERFA